MSIKNIKDEIFKLLSSEKEKVYSSKNLEEKRTHSMKYDVYNQYYMLLSSDNTFSYVSDLKKKALSTSLELEKKYKELLNKYNTEKEVNIKNKLVKEINECGCKLDSINRIYNIFNKNLKSNNDYTKYSDKVIETIVKINNEEDKNTLKSLEEELFRLNEERRARYVILCDPSIIKEVCELESLELKIANAYDSFPPYTMDRKEFLNALKDTISAINEYYFRDYKKSKHYKENTQFTKEENELLFRKRLNLYISKFYSLISAAFNNNYYMIEKGDIRISTDDLINYLSIYNLDETFEIFKNKYKNKMIGNKEVSRFDYENKINYLKNAINILLDQCGKRIKTNSIDIVDKSIDKDELIKSRNMKISKISNIIEGEKTHARR